MDVDILHEGCQGGVCTYDAGSSLILCWAPGGGEGRGLDR